MPMRKSRKFPIFVVYSFLKLKCINLQQLKGMQSSKLVIAKQGI